MIRRADTHGVILLIGVLVGPGFAVAADVSATDQGAQQTDDDGDGTVDGGELIRHTITIDNDAAAGDAATGVQYDNTLDPDTQIVPGSVRISPIALNDSFATAGNVTLDVDADNGLLANDVDPVTGGAAPQSAAAAGVSVTAGTVTTAEGGSVTIQADGSFEYRPEAGDTGITDSFTYTVTDADGITDTATAEVELDGIVWFVDDTGSSGTGTQADPFDINIAGDAAQLFGAGDVDSPGHRIHLLAGTHDAAIELEDNQLLSGQGQALTIDGETIVAAAAAPVLAGPGDIITLANGNTVSGVDLRPDAGFAIAGNGSSNSVVSAPITLSGNGGGVSLTNHFGTFQFTGDIAGGATRSAYAIDGGTPAITHNGTIDTGGARAVAVTNLAGGGATFNGPIANSGAGAVRVAGTSGGVSVEFADVTVTGGMGDAVVLDANAGGASFTFGGDLDLTTSAGAGLVANSTGTVYLADAGTNTIAVDATGGPAIDLANVAVGTMIFDSIASSDASGAGLVVDMVTGDFAVDGATTITNPNGDAISLRGGTADIRLSSGGTVTVDGRGAAGVSIDGTFGTVDIGALDIGARSGGSAAGLSITNTGGNVDFGDVTIADGGGDGVVIAGTSGVTMTSTTVGDTNAVTGRGIDISGANTGTIDLGNGSVKAAGTAFRVNGGSAAVTYSGDLTQTGGRLLRVADHASGDVALAGSHANTGGTGISIANTGASVELTGSTTLSNASMGLDLTNNTGSITVDALGLDSQAGGTGIQVDGGSATVTLTGASSLTQSGGGKALSVDGGSNFIDLSALSISNDGTGASSVIGLSNLAGGRIVLGDTTITNASGGSAAVHAAASGSAELRFPGGIDVRSSGVPALDVSDLAQVTGTFDRISTTGAHGLRLVNLGNAAVTFTDLDVDNSAGGGVLLSNANGSYTFNDLDITSTGGVGFSMRNGGTVTVFDAASDNAIATSGNAALEVVNADIGASGLQFVSIDSDGGTHGIELDSTGAGGLTVTGADGGDADSDPDVGSGGTISATTDAAIRLADTRNVSLSGMRLENTGASAVIGDGLSAASPGSGNNAFTYRFGEIVDAGDGEDEAAIFFGPFDTDTIQDSVTIDNVLFDDYYDRGLIVANTTLSADVTVSDSVFRNAGSNSADGGNDSNAIFLDHKGNGSASAGHDLTVTNTTFGQPVGGAIDSICCDAIDSNADGVGTHSLTVEDSTFQNISKNNSGFGVGSFVVGQADMTVEVRNNRFTNIDATNVGLGVSDDATMTGTIASNTFEAPDIPGVPMSLGGSGGGPDASFTARFLIDNNRVANEQNDYALVLDASGTASENATVDATIVGNTLTSMGNFSETVHISALDGTNVCADVRNNTITTDPASSFDDISVEDKASSLLEIEQSSKADLSTINGGASVSVLDEQPLYGATCDTP